MKRLFIFDMDGTLIPKTTAVLEIAKIMGHEAEIAHLESLYYQKIINNGQFAEACSELWQELTHDVVASAFDNTPKMRNIRIVLKTIQKMGSSSCLITAAPDFYADHFRSFGFDHIFASRPYDIASKKFSPETVLYGKDKPFIAARHAEALRLPFEQAVAFGDSISDVPLFNALRHTISVNGDHHLESASRYSYKGDDLLAAFSLLKD